MGILNDVTWQHVNDILKRLNYDTDSLTITSDTGIAGVKVNIGQEEMYLVCNNSGAQIDNGKAVYASGVDAAAGCLEIELATSTSFQTSAQILGLATHDIPDGTVGLVTSRGIVRDFDTTGLTPGLIWLGTDGEMTGTRPLYPTQRVNMGVRILSGVNDGQFFINPTRISRNDVSKSYSFTSQGVSAGEFWKAGFYDFATTSTQLNQGNLTQTHGVIGRARDAHAGICAGGAGTVNTGQVGLRVTGVMDFEDGTPQAAGQVGIITDDITTLAVDTYYETEEKFSGELTYELYVVSGTPTVYSLDMNYGFAKYDDMQDRDYTITGFECVWQGNFNNSTLDIALIKHTTEGWTYAATGFIAGDGDVCRKTVDMPLAGNTDNNMDGSYKRVTLDTRIQGQLGEGHIIQIITGANNTVQTMDLHVEGVSEELDF